METDSSKITGFRDASFSAYLNTPKANLIVKLTDSSQLSHPAMISSTSSQEIFRTASLERPKAGEGELGIFRAEKYFGMPLVEGVNEGDQIPESVSSYRGKYLHEKLAQADFDRGSKRITGKLGTPSMVSESSYPSQTALLASSSNPSKEKKIHERRFFSGFSCRGTCSDKQPAFVDQGKGYYRKEGTTTRLDGSKNHSRRFKAKEDESFRSSSSHKTSSGSAREDYFLLPTVNSGVRNLQVRKDLRNTKEEEARPSLEVFGSHTIKKEDIAMNLERKLSILSWDAIPKDSNVKTTASTSSHPGCDDIGSDVSSDLFEIENFPIGSLKPIMLAKEAERGMSVCMSPTSHYAPTEASIAWSVVTASAVDFSSAVSEYDEKKLTGGGGGIDPSTRSMAKARIRPNGILGCKSYKAVEIAETAYKRSDKLPN